MTSIDITICDGRVSETVPNSCEAPVKSWKPKLSVQEFSNFVKPYSVEAFIGSKTLWIQRILETVPWKRHGVPSRNALPWQKLYTFQHALQTWNAWNDLSKAFGTHGREQKYSVSVGQTDRKIILKWVYNKWDNRDWTEFVWLRIGTSSWLLWTRQWKFKSHKVQWFLLSNWNAGGTSRRALFCCIGYFERSGTKLQSSTISLWEPQISHRSLAMSVVCA